LQNEIFEYHELHGRQATATRYEINPYLAGMVWMMGRTKLRSTHSAGALMRIARRFQRMSNLQGSSYFGMTRAVLMAVCRIVKAMFRTITGLPKPHGDFITENLHYCLAVYAEIDSDSLPKTMLSFARTRPGRYDWLYRTVSEMTGTERAIYRAYGADVFLDIAQPVFEAHQARCARRRRRSWFSRALTSYRLMQAA